MFLKLGPQASFGVTSSEPDQFVSFPWDDAPISSI